MFEATSSLFSLNTRLSPSQWLENEIRDLPRDWSSSHRCEKGLKPQGNFRNKTWSTHHSLKLEHTQCWKKTFCGHRHISTRTRLYFLDQAKANSKTIRDVCPDIYAGDCSIRLTSLSRSPRIGVATLARSVSTEEWPYTFITWQIRCFGSSCEFLWSIQEAREAKKEPEVQKDADRLSNKHSACRGPAP